MNPLKIWKLFRDYEKLQGILKENVTMNKKATQIVALAVTVIGTLGISDYAQGWVGHHAQVFGALVAAAQILHALFPSIFAAPKTTEPPTGNLTTKAGLLILALLLIPATLKAQTPSNVTPAIVSTAGTPTYEVQLTPEAPAPQVQNLYAGGVSYSVGATPAIAGTGLYAHAISTEGLYAFTVIDALPNTLKPFTVNTNIGAGIAQKLFTLGKVPIYAPTAAGISWNGGNTGWQWNGGVIASIHIRGDYYILPSVRFLKSSVSGGTGYQPIIGVLFGWGR